MRKTFRRLFSQFCSLIVTYFTIRRRKYIQTAVELLVPIVLVTLIVYGSRNEPTKVNSLYPMKPNPGDVIPLTFDKHVDFNMTSFKRLALSPVYYVPDTPDTREIMSSAEKLVAMIDRRLSIKTIAEVNQSTLNARWTKMTPQQQELSSGFVSFINTTGVTARDGQLIFQIEQNGNKFTDINYPWRRSLFSGPNYAQDYSSGFMQLQIVVYQAYLSLRRSKLTNSTLVNVSNMSRFSTRRLPYPEHRVVGWSGMLDQTPIIIAYGIGITFIYLVFRTSNERANGSIEMLLMSGMNRKVYWFTNLLSTYIVMAFISTMQLTIIFTMTKLFSNSSFIMILIQVHIYIIHLILFGQLCTIIFYRPIIVSVVSMIIFIVSFAMVDTLLSSRYNKNLSTERRLSCFLPNSAVVLLFRILVQKEIRGFGLDWHNMNEPMAALGYLSSLEISALQVAWSIVYATLIWYLDQVWPIQSGIPKVFYFPLAHWWRRVHHDDATLTTAAVANDHLQSEPVDRPKVIECVNVTKSFTSFIRRAEKFIAVKDLNLNVYGGSITCLLGHNGAGKTTTMNMITGMMKPNRGTIRINGINLLTDTRKAREKMSLCPQHNSLYEDLTVGEHLRFYAIIKGASHPVDDEVTITMQSLSLCQHRDKLPSELSGGMKRKLCLAIALIAGSTIIILDEPSAGLDTESRREMWDSLKSVRKSRTILLTTHDMEEADALADRIIIMSRGKVISIGSPMYLKKLFSPGYILRILKKNTFNYDQVLAFILHFMPSASIKLDTGSEIIFNLFEKVDSKVSLSTFFKELEDNMSSLGIESFGISMSTLEEVFLRASSLESSDNVSASVNILNDFTCPVDEQAIDEYNLNENLVNGFSLILAQMNALIVKRFIDSLRNYPMIFFQLLIPSLIVMIAFLLTNSNVYFPLLSKSQLITPFMYPSSRVLLQVDKRDKELGIFEAAFKKQVELQRCDYHHLESDANLTQYLIEQSTLVSPERFLHQFIYSLSVKRDLKNDITYEGWINFQAVHSMPLLLHLIAQTEDAVVNTNNSINSLTINLLPSHDLEQLSSLPNIEMIWLMVMSFSLTFMSSFYIFNPVAEVSSKFKLLQLMTGLHPILYHFASFLFDLTVHALSTAIIIGCVYLVDSTPTLTSYSSNLSAIIVAFILFGSIVIVINYIFSSIVSTPAQGYLIVFILFCITGAIFSIVASTLEYYVLRNIISASTFNAILSLLRVSPALTVSWLMKKLYDNGIKGGICSTIPSRLLSSACGKDIYSHCCEETCYDSVKKIDTCVYTNPFGWSGNQINIELVVLTCHLLAVLIILIIKEFWPRIVLLIGRRKCHDTLTTDADTDEDVLKEKILVKSLISRDETSSKALVVSNLCKYYGKLHAVKGVTFTVRKNECFGLLGVNGAGKSSTFSMLTGDINASSGVVYYASVNAFDELRLYQRNIGYCPQVNPILPRLTAREMLTLLARLRGVNQHYTRRLCNKMIRLVNLDAICDKTSGTYSGGGKRKLSIALATIGHPKLVYLDEPTAGVDPNARRVLWSSLMSIRDQFNSSLILTSHSMDECEALCSRISIMISGKFVCLGSPQHLKSRFGRGYTLNVRLDQQHTNQQGYTTLFTQKLKEALHHVELIDRCDINLTYLIARNTGPWSYLFSTMEKMKQSFDIEDYLLTDTTLEQIFIHFSRLRNVSADLIE